VFVQDRIATEPDVPEEMARLLVSQPLMSLFFARKSRAGQGAVKDPSRSRSFIPQCFAGIRGVKIYDGRTASTGPGCPVPADEILAFALCRRSRSTSNGAHAHLRAAPRGKDAVAQFLEDRLVPFLYTARNSASRA